MRQFQFSVSPKDANPPTEVMIDGKPVLSDVVTAETITEAMSKLDSWCNTNSYRIYKAVRK